ncbi:uncharacterized protein [Centroberyx affinis]|uniref:uncharacterized protein n=1 Tax=Centroberyx affinis TaxID=166261 RepID=UPI003A5C15C5
MTEGIEDSSVVPPGSASPTGSTADTGQAPEEKEEETVAGGEGGEEGVEGDAEGGGGGGNGERSGALGILGLARTCCVCIEMEQMNRCLHSEKICILPILACLLSLALCTAGLKWVFVDKIFEYEPPTHLDAKRIGQGPFIISADPTLGLPVSFPHSSSSAASLITAITTTARPEVLLKEKPTGGPYIPQSPRGTQFTPSVALAYHADQPTQSGVPTIPRQTPYPQTTLELNDIIIPTICMVSHVVQDLIKVPNLEEACAIARRFEMANNIPQIIGCIDGTHIPVLPPSDGYRDFVNRKGWPSYVLQAVVEDRYCFWSVNCQVPGSTHDANVLRQSELFKKAHLLLTGVRVIQGKPVRFFLLGDPAYPLMDWLMGYTQSPALTPEQEFFNIHLSSARTAVEMAFGRLKSRWRVLLKHSDFHFTFSPCMVTTCCALHIFCE